MQYNKIAKQLVCGLILYQTLYFRKKQNIFFIHVDIIKIPITKKKIKLLSNLIGRFIEDLFKKNVE